MILNKDIKEIIFKICLLTFVVEFNIIPTFIITDEIILILLNEVTH